MKDKTNGFCIVSCASLILNILLLATVWLMERCAQVMPHSCHITHKQLSIMVRYLDCLNCVILLFVAVDMNNWNYIVHIIFLKTLMYWFLFWFILTSASIYEWFKSYDTVSCWQVFITEVPVTVMHSDLSDPWSIVDWHPNTLPGNWCFCSSTLIWLIGLTKSPSKI